MRPLHKLSLPAPWPSCGFRYCFTLGRAVWAIRSAYLQSRDQIILVSEPHYSINHFLGFIFDALEQTMSPIDE